MTQTVHDYETPREIIEKVTKTTPPVEFIMIFGEVKNSHVLRSILGEGRDDLEEKLKKLFYARCIFNDEQLGLIGEENIIQEGMNLIKIHTIITGGTKNIKPGDQKRRGLTRTMIQAISGELLAHPEMTADKISLLCICGDVNFINAHGPQVIIEMTLDGLKIALNNWENENQ